MKGFTQCISAAALAIGMAGAAQAADIIFIVDESGSMSGEHTWLGNMVTSLEAELVAAGENNNNYGLVGYGASARYADHGVAGHQHLVDGAAFGSAAGLASATSGLVTTGATEDGWEAINFALGNYTFTSSAINFVLVTDEDRDDIAPQLSYAGIEAALVQAGVVLNTVVNANVNSDAGTAVGTNGEDAYVADGAGGYTTADFTGYGSAAGSTISDYSDLAIATGGVSWNLNQLRAGGTTATSFSTAFVDIKVAEIISQPPPLTTPEPSTLVLMTLGLVGIGARRLRK